jgi:hypothetical protein
MDKFKPTEYYIVYDFETMEEPLNHNNENITVRLHIYLNLLQVHQVLQNVFPKSVILFLLSAAWAGKTKSGIKTAYFDSRDGDDFIIKWLQSLIEVAGEVSKDNMYDCINYTIENILNFVPVLGFNSARFDMNFITDILHNPPRWYIEFFIGNLNYFNMVTVRTFDGLCLKFLDAMNYAPPQTLDSFVKTFGNVKEFQKGVFAYDGFNSTNYMEVLNKSEPFAQVNFHSTLRCTDISDKDYEAYLEDWNTKAFPKRWEYLKYLKNMMLKS